MPVLILCLYVGFSVIDKTLFSLVSTTPYEICVSTSLRHIVASNLLPIWKSRSLLKFISRYNYSITFFFLLIFSFFLVLNESFILRSFYFNSSNYISGSFYKVQNGILGYFSLESKNTILINENLKLINRIKKLDSDYRSVVIDTSTVGFLSAQVINNSLNKSKNITKINKSKTPPIIKKPISYHPWFFLLAINLILIPLHFPYIYNQIISVCFHMLS